MSSTGPLDGISLPTGTGFRPHWSTDQVDRWTGDGMQRRRFLVLLGGAAASTGGGGRGGKGSQGRAGTPAGRARAPGGRRQPGNHPRQVFRGGRPGGEEEQGGGQ